MIELSLRRTWDEICQYLNSNSSNPLRIAELVNRFPPCCWTFKFTFDGTNRITVGIDCDFAVSDTDAQAILDGLLAEVLFADALYLRQAGKYFTEDTSKILKNPPSSNLITLQNIDKKADFLLVLKGFWQSDSTPPDIQRNSAVRSYFLEHTWLGAPDFMDSEYYIRWIVFGEEELICPGNRYKAKLGSTDSFTTQETLYNANGDHIGQVSFQTSPLLETDGIYTIFGPLVPKPQNRLTRRSEAARWIIEIGSPILTQAVSQGKPPTSLIDELVDAVENARCSITDSDSFQVYQKKIQHKRQAVAAKGLKERQERVQKANRVFFRGKPVMLVPENENEVLVLLCKLEALHALPFYEFILWEYTARTGIDAIASYQIEATSVPVLFATVEMEYHFENFLDHKHPHNQVNLVICWDFRGGKVPAELRQHSECLFEYRNDDSFTILILSKIPDLQLKGVKQ